MHSSEISDPAFCLKQLFGKTSPFLVPDGTGIDVIRSLEFQSPIRTGMKVIDQELPLGIENGQIIEIRGRPSSGKVSFSV